MNTSSRLSIFLMVALIAIAPSSASAITIYYNAPSPALDTWTDMSIPLSGDGWTVDDWNGGVVATQEQIEFVLANLAGFYILTEWRTGADDTNVDNVAFGSGASNTFDTSNEGWFAAGPDPESDMFGQLIGTGALPFDANFGNPAGSVRLQDVFGWTWIGAPAAYLGNQSGRYDETLSFDLFIRETDGIPYPAVALVAPDEAPVTPIPEPGALVLVGSGLVAAMRRARRARH